MERNLLSTQFVRASANDDSTLNGLGLGLGDLPSVIGHGISCCSSWCPMKADEVAVLAMNWCEFKWNDSAPWQRACADKHMRLCALGWTPCGEQINAPTWHTEWARMCHNRTVGVDMWWLL